MNISPWITIWTRPRSTIAAIVAESPNHSLFALSAIYGFGSLLTLFQAMALGQMVTPTGLLILAVVLSPFWGYLQISVWSYFVYKIGSWLKGEGSFVQVRAAYTWSLVPMILNIPLWLLMVYLFGHQLFLNFPDAATLPPMQVNFLFGVLLVKMAVAIWSLVIYINGLAWCQKFSMLRTIGNVILAGIAVYVVLMALWTALAYLLSAR